MAVDTVAAKQKKADDVIPKDTADKWERLTKLASERLFGKRKKIMVAVGRGRVKLQGYGKLGQSGEDGSARRYVI